MSAGIKKPLRLRDVLRFWQRKRCGTFGVYVLGDIAIQLSTLVWTLYPRKNRRVVDTHARVRNDLQLLISYYGPNYDALALLTNQPDRQGASNNWQGCQNHDSNDDGDDAGRVRNGTNSEGDIADTPDRPSSRAGLRDDLHNDRASHDASMQPRKKGGDDACATTRERLATDEGETCGSDELTAELATPQSAGRVVGSGDVRSQRIPATTNDTAGCDSFDTRGQGHNSLQFCNDDAGAVDVVPDLNSFSAYQKARLKGAVNHLFAFVSGRRTADTIHRWDARKLCVELLTNRLALHRARQHKMRPQYLVVITDWSGSCAHASDYIEAAAQAIARIDGVVVCPTGKGDPEGIVVLKDCYGDSALLRQMKNVGNMISNDEQWRQMRDLGVHHVLAMGDVHGRRAYEAIVKAGVRLGWIDPNPDMMFTSPPHLGYRYAINTMRKSAYFPIDNKKPLSAQLVDGVYHVVNAWRVHG
ncbi:MAG: hypothetical protein D6712_21125 [Chloroflexi bacterium]|nr:MAG: hypothetical protein D6712_21125 [Chloroflexota bacterium]